MPRIRRLRPGLLAIVIGMAVVLGGPAAVGSFPVATVELTATPAPAANGQPRLQIGQAGATREVELVEGWNLVSWTGPTTPIEDATAAIAGGVDSVFTWDTDAQDFRSYRPEGPDFLNTLVDLQPGDGVWLRMTQADAWSQPNEILGPREVPLAAGFNLVAWSGADGTDTTAAFAPVADDLRAAYTWDAAEQRFLSANPELPPSLNTLRTLDFGAGVWIEVGVEAIWSQDAPGGTALRLARPPILDYVDHLPPRAERLSVTAPDADGVVTVTASAGVAPANANVLVASLSSGDFVFERALTAGAFVAQLRAASGSSIVVRYDAFGSVLPPHDPSETNHWPGALIRVPRPAGLAADGFAGGATLLMAGGGVHWAAQGTVSGRQVEPGASVAVTGALTVDLPPGSGATGATVVVELGLAPLFDANGAQIAAGADFVSHLRTPTGLPIERSARPPLTIGESSVTLSVVGGGLVGQFDVSGVVPASLPTGTYRLVVGLQPGPDLEALAADVAFPTSELLHRSGPTAALLTVGDPAPPTLTPMLLANTPAQGQRGVLSVADQDRVGFTGRLAPSAPRFIIPPRDLGSGRTIQYRLEPFFPQLSLADRGLPGEPPLPLALPGGELSATVVAPSGATRELGPAAIMQIRTGNPATSEGAILNAGGGNPGAIVQLTTLDDGFLVAFSEYGRHTIRLRGQVEDVWGGVYPFEADYEIWVAETLDIETAALPGTPFEAGDALPAVAQVYPGVPAQIDWALTLYPADGGSPKSGSVNGIANRFGYFDGAGTTFQLDEGGEYRVDLVAEYESSDGTLWMASRSWAGGVATGGPLTAHGARGIDTQTAGRAAWYTREATRIPIGDNAISFPYFSGDVVWATDGDAVRMRLTVEDADGAIAGLLEERASQSTLDYDTFARRVFFEELPLLVSTSSGFDAALDPADIDQWGYAYRSVQRPGERVRESIGVDHTQAPVSRFDDTYLMQWGMGLDGDRTNDLAWQFGAAVFRRPGQATGEVAIYGSLRVQIADGDTRGSRVFPPFQGAAGGPSGGPLLTLRGEEIDLFLLPLGVRPGAVLEVGDRFEFAGQIGPALPSRVGVVVTSPSGETRSIDGTANAIGYFAAPQQSFVVTEPGLWTVTVGVEHDGLTSVGAVEEPFPRGGVLGAVAGPYTFFVVPRTAPRIDTGLGNFQIVDLGAGAAPAPVRIVAAVPPGWTDVEADYSITMPGYIIEQAEAAVSNDTVTVVYDPVRLQRNFPNIDLTARHTSEPGLSDEIVITLLLRGTDAGGQPRAVAKQLLLVGDDLYALN